MDAGGCGKASDLMSDNWGLGPEVGIDILTP